MYARVFGPTRPAPVEGAQLILTAHWKRMRAAWVAVSKYPVGAAERYPEFLRYCCSTLTSFPLLPFASGWVSEVSVTDPEALFDVEELGVEAVIGVGVV